MSVLIKGMNMPNVCGVCEIADAIKCDGWKHVRSVMLDRNKHCPLVEVSTPHGDLIDRDVVRRKYQEMATYAYTVNIKAKMETVINACIDQLEYAPTVIESEE